MAGSGTFISRSAEPEYGSLQSRGPTESLVEIGPTPSRESDSNVSIELSRCRQVSLVILAAVSAATDVEICQRLAVFVECVIIVLDELL
jgi:hypothetical protein